MLEPAATDLLSAGLPSERARSAEWFLANAEPKHSALLLAAIERESVPRIQRLLHGALKRAENAGVRSTPAASSSSDSPELPKEAEILESLAGLIRHETEPAIGWLRRAAAKEIGDEFVTSETFRQIEQLRQRLLGLEVLAAAHRLPRWTRTSLSDLVSECRPPSLPTTALHPELTTSGDLIDTDPGLLALIVGNALRNAHEASQAGAPDGSGVWVETGVTDRDFWISITNRFQGESFELDHVAHTGTSSKENHKGLGLSAMRLAAQRLGYELTLSAQGGTAFFSLRGQRFHG